LFFFLAIDSSVTADLADVIVLHRETLIAPRARDALGTLHTPLMEQEMRVGSSTHPLVEVLDPSLLFLPLPLMRYAKHRAPGENILSVSVAQFLANAQRMRTSRVPTKALFGLISIDATDSADTPGEAKLVLHTYIVAEPSTCYTGRLDRVAFTRRRLQPMHVR
jgi:hypothetical protein